MPDFSSLLLHDDSGALKVSAGYLAKQAFAALEMLAGHTMGGRHYGDHANS